MCSINHELKAIYVHVPKNGGLYIQHILEKYYNFKTLYFTRSDHNKYDPKINIQSNLPINGFIKIRKDGILRYYKTSIEHNNFTNMTDDKWNSYYKFTFVRNPYSKFVSAYKYLITNQCIPFEQFIDNIQSYNNYIYTHAFITQYDHLIDDNGNLNYNYIGKFENLNEDLVKILFEIGISKIKHGEYINKNIIINNSLVTKNYTEYYNPNILNKINDLFNIDFEMFNYTKYYDTLINQVCQPRNITNNILYSQLKNNDKLEIEDDDLKIILDNGISIQLNNKQFNHVNKLYENNSCINSNLHKEHFYVKLLQNLKPIEKKN